MSLLVRWRAVRCEGFDRKRRRDCRHINHEVPTDAPRLRYRFRCSKCGSWNTVEA